MKDRKKIAAKWLVPLCLLGILVLFLFQSLCFKSQDDLLTTLDRKLPAFKIITVEDPKVFLTESDFQNRVSVVNVWASWCQNCSQTHDELMQLVSALSFQHPDLQYADMQSNVQMIGLNFHDTYEDANQFLKEHGSPYQHSLFDGEGRFAMDCGVTRIPELLIIDHQGILRYRYSGSINKSLWYNQIKPRIEALQTEHVQKLEQSSKAAKQQSS